MSVKELNMSPTETSEYPAKWHDALAGLVVIFLVLVPVVQMLTLKILLQKDNRRKRLTPYLINLAVANLIFAFFSFPLSLASNLSRRYIADKPVCIFLGYLSSAAVLVTFATFAFCIRVVYNATNTLKTTQFCIFKARKKYTKINLGMWFFAFVMLSPMVPFWNRDTFHPGTSGCYPMRSLENAWDITYFVVLTVLAFCVPMTISFVYSIKIYLFFVNNKPCQISFTQQRRYQEYRNVSKMIIVSVVIFVVCWSPFTIVGVLSMLGYSPSPELRAIPYFLSKSSVLYNPLIYVIFNAK